MTNTPVAKWPAGIPKEVEFPRGNVVENLIQVAARFPERPALIYHQRSLSYAQTLQKVGTLAGYLAHECGVAKGDRVILYMQNSPQFILTYYAILRANAVCIPVNPMSRAAEVAHIVADSGAKVALCGSEVKQYIAPLLEDELDRLIIANYADMADLNDPLPFPEAFLGFDDTWDHERAVPWSHALGSGFAPPPITAKGDDMALIPYSSGTTGKPKGCVHTHYSVNVTAVGGVYWNPVTDEDVSLACLPLFHVTGMQACMNGAIYAGQTIVIMSRWDRRVAAGMIARHRVTRWRSITTMAIDLVNDPDFETYDLSSLTAIGGGGAAMPEAIALKLKDMTGLDYVEGYGMSETMAATHINPIDAPRPQCLGIPVFDVDSRVIDPATMQEVPVGEVGEILLHGPQMFQGYWNNPKATEETLIEFDGKTFVRSGDMGYVDQDGYFYMVDRLKRMINASGFKVWPAEVEALMLRHPDIREACIIASPDERRGETVKAVIVAQDVANPPKAEEVIAWCKTQMATYKCPTKIEFVEALPKSGSNKILWRVLTEAEFA